RGSCTILAEIDIETPATKKYDLEKSKDEIRHDLKLHKSVPKSSQYASTPTNFARTLRRENRHEKQMKLFIEYLGTFIDTATIATLALYVNLHARIDDMEVGENEGLKDLIIKDIEKFVPKLKKAQEYILKLEQKR
ncbi:hypothetical protein HAX54_041515, partial [Datura stramonium]|nr:hypothetical protein [Datura stramonium]